MAKSDNETGTGSTMGSGAPAPSDRNSLTIGPDGPIMLHDVHFLEQMAHFNREKVPERQPHAKGAGAFGVFKATEDVSAYTKAALLNTYLFDGHMAYHHSGNAPVYATNSGGRSWAIKSRAACSAASAARCSNGPSNTGRTSTPISGSGSRRGCRRAVRRDPPKA